MRFPWLQVDADFIGAHAGDLGVLLGISRREAMGLALDLWTWALARAKGDAPPDGLITGTGPEPDRLLAGSVGYSGPAEQFSAALVAVGLAVRVDSGYRLTGFSRYKATWEKNRRRSGGKPERNRTGTGEEPARKTQTQTQTQTQKEERQPPSVVAVAPPAIPEQASLGVMGDPPPAKKPRKEATGPNADLWCALEAEYQQRMGVKYASGNGGADAATVSWLLANTTPTEAVRRWGLLLEWAKGGFPKVSGFGDLRSNWNAPQVVGLPVAPRRTEPERVVMEKSKFKAGIVPPSECF